MDKKSKQDENTNELQMEEIDVRGNGKKKIVLAITCFIVIVFIVILIVTFVNKIPVNKLETALNRGDYETVIQIYDDNIQNKEIKKIIEEHKVYTVEQYQYGYIEYDDAKKILSGISPLISVDEELNLLYEIKISKTKYNQALDNIEMEEYDSAIKLLNEIIDKDIENYDKAQVEISKVLQLCIEKSNQMLLDKLFEEAYDMLEITSDYSNISEEVNELKSEIIEEYQTALMTEVEEFVSNKKYIEAYKRLESLDEIYLNEQLKNILEDAKLQYIDSKLDEASKMADDEQYKEAIEILTLANGQIKDNEFTVAINAYELEYNSMIISNCKSDVICKYDSIDKIYKIFTDDVKYGYIGISSTRNMQAMLNCSDNAALFGIYFGFHNDDWIFMEEIIVDCDGTQYSIPVKYFDRQTEVLWGGDILEAYLVDDTNYSNMEDMIESMIDANKVTVRFKGEGYLDFTIPKSHLSKMYSIWQIYQVLKNAPDLVQDLI